MSDNERTGTRNLTYNYWHRTKSIKRFLPTREAWSLGMIDIDDCEYCRRCGTPLALIEAQESTNTPKRAVVTENLARMSGLPAFSMSYTVTDGDITLFQVQRIEPPSDIVKTWQPSGYAQFLFDLRRDHICPEAN